jgi:WD40 repeat protein
MSKTLFCTVLSSCVLALATPANAGPPRTDRYGDPLPEGAIARLGTVRLGHSDPIEAVAFSPDGKAIASAARDVRLWDLATGTLIRRFDAPNAWLGQVEFSPDGKTVFAADCGTDAVYCWETATGRLLRHIGRPPLGQSSMKRCQGGRLPMSPDGRMFATSVDGLHLWDTESGRQLRELVAQRHRMESFFVAFSPDGKLLALATAGTDIRLWNMKGFAAPRVLSGPRRCVPCIAFSPDGTELASAEADGTIRLWSIRTGKSQGQLTGPKKLVTSLVFTPDGKGLITADLDRITLWDLTTGREVRCFGRSAQTFASLTLSADGKVLAAGGLSRIRLWEVATGKEALAFEGHFDAVRSLAFSPDGTTLASGGDGAILWRLRDFALIRRIDEGLVSVDPVAYSRDGKRLAFATRDPVGGDQGVCLYEPSTGKLLVRVNPTCRSVAISPEATSFVGVHSDGPAELWDIASGKPVRKLQEPQSPVGKSDGVYAMSPDGTAVILGSWESGLELRRLRDWQKLPLEDAAMGWGVAAAFSPDGTLIAGSLGVTIWDAKNGRIVRRMARVRRHANGSELLPGRPHARLLRSKRRCSGVGSDDGQRASAFSHSGRQALLALVRGLFARRSVASLRRPRLRHPFVGSEGSHGRSSCWVLDTALARPGQRRCSQSLPRHVRPHTRPCSSSALAWGPSSPRTGRRSCENAKAAG